MGSDEVAVTDRTRLRRKAERGRFDRETINEILDEGFVCHVGFALDGRPWVMPMVYTRADDALYLHGAVANHMLQALASSIDVCVTVTLVDALVLARSAFHQSINYRSLMVFGRAVLVEDADEKCSALLAVVDHVVPGRADDVRPPNDNELRATRVLRLDINEVSAKVRTGDAIEEPEDLDLPTWGGQLPLRLEVGPPIADERVLPAVIVPAYALEYTRPGAASRSAS